MENPNNERIRHMSTTTTYRNDRGTVYGVTVSMVMESCCNCAMPFQMPEDFRQRALKDHSISFYCPAGHRQHYTGETREQSLARQLRYAESRETSLRDQYEAEKRSAAAYRGHVTRIRNLVARGVCPVGGCRRNFTNVREHMATVHPEFHTHEEA